MQPRSACVRSGGCVCVPICVRVCMSNMQIDTHMPISSSENVVRWLLGKHTRVQTSDPTCKCMRDGPLFRKRLDCSELAYTL